MKNLLKISAFLFLIVLSGHTNAQRLLVGGGGGYATFTMSDTKDYNDWVQNNLPFTPKLTDDFPGWVFFNAEVLYSFPKIVAAGVKVSTTSTGSRLNLADYSGEYTFDNTQKGWFPGVKLLLGKAPGQKSGLCGLVEGGLAFSSMTLDEKLVIFDEETSDQSELSAFGFYVQPGVTYMQNIGKHIVLSANISYYFGFENGYHLKGEKEQKMIHPETNEKIKPGWNGLRAGLVLYWGFGMNEKSKDL